MEIKGLIDRHKLLRIDKKVELLPLLGNLASIISFIVILIQIIKETANLFILLVVILLLLINVLINIYIFLSKSSICVIRKEILDVLKNLEIIIKAQFKHLKKDPAKLKTLKGHWSEIISLTTQKEYESCYKHLGKVDKIITELSTLDLPNKEILKEKGR